MGGRARANEMFLDGVGRGHVATGSRAESVSQPIARVAGYKEAHTYSLTVTWLRDAMLYYYSQISTLAGKGKLLVNLSFQLQYVVLYYPAVLPESR